MTITMNISNFTEKAVRSEVSQIKEDDAAEQGQCWCPLCEADTICLSLSSIPPCYGRTRPQEILRQNGSSSFVRTAVARARNRVNTNPRHGKVSVFPSYEIVVVNYSFDEGARLLDEVMQEDFPSCTCPQCRADTLAFAMNRIPPIYGVGFSGRTSFTPQRKEFVRQDIRKTLRAAATAVTSAPRH